ncbi:MAG: hypothetical protein HZB11_03295 [Candidatus Yonathbacteria bacterium]|nr:hypothetical protein [Candidatus Yonathbacteria bacterium]
MKKILHFFDKLEDSIRALLSRHDIFYAFIGGIAMVLFWRGVWMIADTITFLTPVISIFISVIVLLATGLFVSFFVGDRIILSGLKKDKKFNEKVAAEVKTELDTLKDIQNKMNNIEQELKMMRAEMKSGAPSK